MYDPPRGDIDTRLEISTDGTPDLWDLTIAGNVPAGLGRKAGGGTYEVRLTKR
jgi:hypothetical protein